MQSRIHIRKISNQYIFEIKCNLKDLFIIIIECVCVFVGTCFRYYPSPTKMLFTDRTKICSTCYSKQWVCPLIAVVDI